MPSFFQDAFAPSTAVAIVLMLTLVLHVALAGRSGWKCRLGGIAHFVGVVTQGYVGWTALDAVVSSGADTPGWLNTVRGANVNYPLDSYLPTGHCGPFIDALLLIISLHIARVMWSSIRPRECTQWLEHGHKSSNKI